MSSRKILDGLQDALAHAQGEKGRGTERRVKVATQVDVRAIRQRLQLTQQEFADSFGFTIAAIRHWEQGSRVPEASARVLLTLIARDPNYVLETLEMD